MKLHTISCLAAIVLMFCITLVSSCQSGSGGGVEPDTESKPRGTMVVEPYCREVFADLGAFTSRTTEYGYMFKVTLDHTYEKFPYTYLYVITPDSTAFLPLELTGDKEKANGLGYSTVVYSCCATSPPVDYPRLYNVLDMTDFTREPEEKGYLYPKSGTYKFVLLFKETPDFEKGGFISTKVMDFPESFLDYPCHNDGSGYKPKVSAFEVTF